MLQRAVSAVGGGGGGNAETLVTTSDLAQNAYEDFTVSSSTYTAIGFRGTRTDNGLECAYFRADPFSQGLFGRIRTDQTYNADLYNDSQFFSFPNSTTLRFTNSVIGAGGLKAGTTIVLVH